VDSIEEYQFKQLIDHNDPTIGTFPQRYYIDETYGKEDNSPVFFYICGESSCSKRALAGAIRNYAKTYHAKLVALEHRYYGVSLPTPTFSTDHLKYLNTEAALDDLAHFQRYLQAEKNWTGKWISFGGSYPGSLSAYYRLKFPYLVVGAIASSAPVQAKEDFVEYDAHVAKVVGPKCRQQMMSAIREVEEALNDEKKLNEIKAQFAATEINDSNDFLFLIADIGSVAVQYGQKNMFCNALDAATTPLEGYANIAQLIFATLGAKAVDFTAQGAMSESPSDYKEWFGLRQWFYQSCTEYGYWQNAHSDPDQSTRSQLVNLDYHRNVCKRLFGLDAPANVDKTNNDYYQYFAYAMVTHILFTNGEHDPWSNLSLSEKNGNAENPNLSYFEIEKASHCEDLHAPTDYDSESLKASRIHTSTLIGEWLKS
jgi:pimeloyl-ACP methyl ester carboxylesterase